MKEKKEIIFRKNKKETTKEITIFNKNKLVKELFDEYKFIEGESFNTYKIKDDIEYIYLKNIIFKRETKFRIPNNTTLILDNCTFNKGKVDIYGGNFEIINPNLNPCYYTNRFYISDVNNLNIVINKNSNGYMTIAGNAKNFSIDAKNKISGIALEAKNIKINNLNDAKILALTGENITIENSTLNLEILSQFKNQLNSKNINLKNSKLYYQTDIEQININVDNLSLENSYILFMGGYLINTTIGCKKLELKDSKIDSTDSITLLTDEILLDDNSEIVSSVKIQMHNNIYLPQKNSEIAITKDNLNETEEEQHRRKLISILKGINQVLTEEVKKEKNTVKKELLQRGTSEQKANKLAKKKISNMLIYRKIKTYRSISK